MYYSEDLLSEDECPHFSQAFLMSQTGNPSNPIFQTQVLDSSHFREFHHPTGSAFFQLQLEALNGSSLSEAVSHIKVKYAGKDMGKRRCFSVSRVGVMFFFFFSGWGLVWRCSWISETKDILGQFKVVVRFLLSKPRHVTIWVWTWK